MAGHSKWANIKHKKGRADAKRGKVFGKVIREITVAAKQGGDPEANPRLRLAIFKAKSVNMPSDNIDRAIKKGSGAGNEDQYEELTLEGYGPNGVAVLVDILTDNRNRSVADVRHIFSKSGGSLGEAGCVAWMFERKGLLIFPKTVGEDALMEVALEAGAEDIQDIQDFFQVITAPNDLDKIKTACEAKELTPESAEIQMIPQNLIKIEEAEKAEKTLKLMETLEDSDDVQNVHANFDIDDSLMEKVSN